MFTRMGIIVRGSIEYAYATNDHDCGTGSSSSKDTAKTINTAICQGQLTWNLELKRMDRLFQNTPFRVFPFRLPREVGNIASRLFSVFPENGTFGSRYNMNGTEPSVLRRFSNTIVLDVCHSNPACVCTCNKKTMKVQDNYMP